MRNLCLAVAGAALTIPSLVNAQTATIPASPTDERRLSAEQVEAVLTESAAKRTASQKQVPVEITDEEDLPSPAPQVHGEVGFTIGTGGYREAYGTAIYPLEDGVVAISFDFADWGRRRWPH